MSFQTTPARSRVSGFSVSEMMVSLVVFGVVMAAAVTGSTSITGVMATAENYSVGQLATVDYLTLDLRRANSDFEPTVVGDKLTLPITLGLPQYYSADGRTPNPGQRTIVTVTNKRKHKKKHRVLSARYYSHYGTLGATVPVQYYLLNGSLHRKEGSQPARVIGTDIAEVTFTSPDVGPTATAAEKKAAINANPVVVSTVSFLPTRRSKTTPPPLSNSTFLRQYYYSEL
jgi:prepilin-type N-terminal cleavage/methylation domain-containing protein